MPDDTQSQPEACGKAYAGHKGCEHTHTATDPLPVGTLVEYHGSQPWYHGKVFVITAVKSAQELTATGRDPVRDYYIDHVGYELWQEGVEQRWGNRDCSIHFVRRTSITVHPHNGIPEGL